MGDLGLVVNARNSAPNALQLDKLGLTRRFVRTIVYDFSTFDSFLSSLAPTTQAIALLNSETRGVGNDYAGWLQVVTAFAERFKGRVRIVECGNELDLLNVPATLRGRIRSTDAAKATASYLKVIPTSVADRMQRNTLQVVSAAALVRMASPALRAAGMRVALTSVAGPHWIDYLETLAASTRGYADYANLHPYGQRAAGHPTGWGFGELSDAIETAHQVSGLPVVLTEGGIKVGDAGGLQGQATYVSRWAQVVSAFSLEKLALGAYFAWSDAIGGPTEQGDQGFGLLDGKGKPRPAWQAFASAALQSEPQIPPGRYTMGFKDWHDADPALLGDPLDPVEVGGIPGFSAQGTERGELTAVNLADPNGQSAPAWRMFFVERDTRRRYVYDNGTSRRIA